MGCAQKSAEQYTIRDKFEEVSICLRSRGIGNENTSEYKSECS